MPILRVKQSEYLALGALDDDVADAIVPLVYQVPASEDDDDALDAARRRIRLFADKWGNRPAFYDPELALQYDGLDAATLYEQASLHGPYAPAATLNSDRAAAAAHVANDFGRAALRITDPLAVLDPGLEDLLNVWVDNIGLDLDRITLIFDVGSSEDARTAGAMLRVPFLERWGEVVLAGGVFEAITQPTESIIPRTHLSNWRGVTANTERSIIFGDYGTLESTYTEPARYPAAAKLTYTEPEHWFYVRGRSIQYEGNEQIYELAEVITQRAHWRGADYSWGDAWIADRAGRQPSAGNAAMWIRVALTHHITHVVREDV